MILDTNPIIDPAGYSQFSEEQVAASKAYDLCMSESRQLFASRGLTGRSNVVTWILIIPGNILAALLLGISWVVAILGVPRRTLALVLWLLTAVSIVAASLQFRYADTIELVGWITN